MKSNALAFVLFNVLCGADEVITEVDGYGRADPDANANLDPRSAPKLLESTTKVKRCKRGWFAFPPTHSHVGLALEMFGEWDEEAIVAFEHYIKQGDVVVDVGAHLGAYAIVFGQLVGDEGFVHAFEPQTRLFQLLNTNIVLNDQFNGWC
jgi:hypothetical protein